MFYLGDLVVYLGLKPVINEGLYYDIFIDDYCVYDIHHKDITVFIYVGSCHFSYTDIFRELK